MDDELSFDEIEDESPFGENAQKSTTQKDVNREFIRAEQEDDDGYDPYSDRVEYTPLFERDPWD